MTVEPLLDTVKVDALTLTLTTEPLTRVELPGAGVGVAVRAGLGVAVGAGCDVSVGAADGAVAVNVTVAVPVDLIAASLLVWMALAAPGCAGRGVVATAIPALIPPTMIKPTSANTNLLRTSIRDHSPR